MPWPLVHPPLIRVPNPTNKPATINKINELEMFISISLLKKNLQKIGPIISPAKNKKLSDQLNLFNIWNRKKIFNKMSKNVNISKILIKMTKNNMIWIKKNLRKSYRLRNKRKIGQMNQLRKK